MAKNAAVEAVVPTVDRWEGRQLNPIFVPWMTQQFPSVDGKEYRAFRKSKGMTHKDFTVQAVTAHFGSKKASRDEIIAHLLTFTTKTYAADDLNVQIPQYLSQLTFRGWSGLINSISKVLEGRSSE